MYSNFVDQSWQLCGWMLLLSFLPFLFFPGTDGMAEISATTLDHEAKDGKEKNRT